MESADTPSDAPPIVETQHRGSEASKPPREESSMSERLGTSFYPTSFNCNRHISRVEMAICTDEDLAELDRELAKRHAEELRHAKKSPGVVKQLKARQKEWLEERNRACSGAESIQGCLKGEYERRLLEIES